MTAAHPVLQAERLGKLYRLGYIGSGSLAQDLSRWWARLRGRPDPLAKIVEGRAGRQAAGHLWALRDVSFSVDRGEILGIVGQNGAGKSTLLKILTKITRPTSGLFRVRGRVASLLEVGTGFHPELSGRENVFLNGAILGMTRAEVARKFDEIVAFAEVGPFIDTPVKRYSSGMYVRLAFAVAAHLEPDILLVDEVLAVGDAAFQRKCLGKMGDAAGQGRTVLFVSHNMAAMERLCPRALLIDEGRLVMDGPCAEVIAAHLRTLRDEPGPELAYAVNLALLDERAHPDMRIRSLELATPDGAPLRALATGQGLELRIGYEARRQFVSPAFAVHLNDHLGRRLVQLNTSPISGQPVERLGARGTMRLRIDALPLTAGTYTLDVGFVREQSEWVVKLERAVTLRVTPRDVYGSGMALDQSRGAIVVGHRWEHEPGGPTP
ncbi:ABC transporter ATP-binding protein [Desulfocurvus sp.]|uniref:ABC transporter ATP-binding protein n=1 Tax=Desulfocurvus sp. TaxID=2871698 RepID=UPI0025BE310B|nr:ABC transporter ATP-binding protein [Desulfocurvus sp.]MCK9238801.1 ABC transporter ATP-binding protein [Desulfocurvus sp.]